MIWLYLIALVFVYFLAVFVFLPLAVPLMRTESVSGRIPNDATDAIEILEKHSDSPYEYLQAVHSFLLDRNTGGRYGFVMHLRKATISDVSYLLSTQGHLHNHQFNYLARVLLVRSKFFEDSDVRLKSTFLNLFIHQYLQVFINGQWYDVDPWAAHLGVPLGSHAVGFR